MAKPRESRRASHMLLWYPRAWRERYGDEFGDHLEQEFTDRPRDLARTWNVAYKGLVARVADVGLIRDEMVARDLDREAAGTTYVLAALVGFVAVAFWSRVMGLWNSYHRASVPNSIATAVLTVTTALVALILVVIAMIIGLVALGQLIRRRGRRLAVPVLITSVSGGFLIYASRGAFRMFDAYLRGNRFVPGIRLTQPGRLIKAIAEIAWAQTQSWIALWTQGQTSTPVFQRVVNDFVPVALVAFSVGAALLIRRVDLPGWARRIIRVATPTLGLLSAAFLVSYLMWIAVGGQDLVDPFFPEGFDAAVGYLVLLGVATALMGRASQMS